MKQMGRKKSCLLQKAPGQYKLLEFNGEACFRKIKEVLNMGAAMEKKILVVDDEEDMRKSVSLILRRKLNGDENCSVIACDNARDAIEKIKEDNIDVVISDIRMPEMSGLELLDMIRIFNKQMPVILMTAYADLTVSVNAIREGANDFIIKPLDPDYLVKAVGKAIQHCNFIKLKESYKHYLEHKVVEKTNELQTASMKAEEFSAELIKRLITVAKFRDTEGGEHIARIGIFSELIARALGMSPEFAWTIRHASPLHDIGKVGIVDYILCKPASLSCEEQDIIKTHAAEGAKILSGSSNPVIQMAASIALNHHERWDGTGYPRGLRGEEIPIEGRIVNLCDQYDAIRSMRVYKPEFTHEKTCRILKYGDGRTMPQHFDPKVLCAFIRTSQKFDEIYSAYSKNPEDGLQ